MTPALAAVRARFAAAAPSLSEADLDHRAGVALVLREDAGALSLLMIRRAENEGDQWSGDIAFPGGRVDPSDATPRAAAERETREEVGLALEPGDYLGRLSDIKGNAESIVVSAFVYGVEDPPELVPNHEVAQAFWVPVSAILDEANHVERDFRYRDIRLPLPALRVLDPEHPVLWGLSYRFLEELVAHLGAQIPSMSWDDSL